MAVHKTNLVAVHCRVTGFIGEETYMGRVRQNHIPQERSPADMPWTLSPAPYAGVVFAYTDAGKLLKASTGDTLGQTAVMSSNIGGIPRL